MTWRWLGSAGGVKPPPLPENLIPAGSIDSLLARANAFRDAGRWPEAAETYQAVLERTPDQPALWVQFGHAKKESGDLVAAEAAYRRSLEISPNVADTYLQLGHVLKIRGQRAAAVTAYASALRVDRFLTPALMELMALGEAWTAEQASGNGEHMLAEMLQAVGELRGSLHRLERMLPAVASLNSFPPRCYDLFRARYALPSPPAIDGEPTRWGVLALDTNERGEPIRLCRSLADQDSAPVAVAVVSPRRTVWDDLRQVSMAGLRCPVSVSQLGATLALPQCEWLLVIDTRVVLLPNALTWLSWAVSRIAAPLIYADEDHLRLTDAGTTIAERPVLKATYDPEASSPSFGHGMIALRATVAADAGPTIWSDPDPISEFVERVAANGSVAHLPRILCQRRTDLPRPRSRASQPVGAPAHRRIGVVIPTRDGVDLLRTCIESVRRTAAEPSRLDLFIIDNGSTDPATLDLFASLKDTGSAHVLHDAAAFNWARSSNVGATASTTELLLFLNNDVEITTHGWDAILRRHLGRPEIGAVGARLLYPDGTLQHGGMVLGPDGRAEHEGVAVDGVPDDIAARWIARRRVGAITGAFLACRRTDFDSVGRFDETHLPIWFNDLDFCLRLRRAGRLILYAPEITATHYESRTLAALPEDPRRHSIWSESLAEMRRRWGPALATDPGFNPYFARTGRPFEAMIEPSIIAISEHLTLSAQRNPWALS